MRRFHLLVVAASLLLVGWVAAPAASLGPYVPQARDFTLRIDDDAAPFARIASAAKRNEYVSSVLKAPKRFDLVGLTWTDRRGLGEHAHIRVRREGGSWSDWTELHAVGHAEEGAGRAPRSTEPMWTGGSDEFQLRLERPVTGLKASFVNTTGTATAADRARTKVARATRGMATALAAPFAYARRQVGPGEPPPIISREQWGAEQCKPRGEPDYGRVQLAFVHHTVSSTNYTREQSASMVLGICRYHRNTNGWNDIGYNFVVDQFGQVFEGRAGGVDQPVVGAQAQGYNAESTGVATLGTFGDTALPEAGIAAVAKLIAWKLPLSGSPTAGTVVVTSAGGDTNRYPKGTQVTLPRIAGHRDSNSTECPGTALYNQLGDIRARVGDRVPAAGQTVPPPPGPTASVPAKVATTLSARPASRSVTYPDEVSVSGRLVASDGSPLAGAPVVVEYKSSKGDFRKIGPGTTTAGDGSWSLRVPTAFSRVLRASYAGDAARVASRSAEMTVAVAARMSLRPRARRVQVGRRVDLRGGLRPVKKRLEVLVETGSGGRYSKVDKLRVSTKGKEFRAVRTMKTPGLYRFTARFAGDEENAAARSEPVFVRVTRTPSAGGGGASFVRAR